jgi:AcrR family transcriptional regulator
MVSERAMAPPASRRERTRAAAVEEIKATALRLLVDEGPASVTLRAIAREMGMTAPGLYRYFPSHEDLLSALVQDTYDRLAGALVEAREDVPADDAAARLVAVARAFRDWASRHPREFGLVFATPVPPIPEVTGPVHLAGMRFGAVFTEIFLQLWSQRPFPVPDAAALPTELTTQLLAYRETLAQTVGEGAREVPLGALHVFLRCWVQLYGLVAMEIYSHLHFCLTDVAPFFEANLHDLGLMLGIEKVLPVPRSAVRRAGAAQNRHRASLA